MNLIRTLSIDTTYNTPGEVEEFAFGRYMVHGRREDGLIGRAPREMMPARLATPVR